MIEWGDVQGYGSSEVVGAVAYVRFGAVVVLIARVERTSWRVATARPASALPAEILSSGQCRDIESGKEEAERSVESILVALLYSTSKTPDRAVAWCAILLRDELVLRGAQDVVGELSDPTMRTTFLEQVLQVSAGATVTADHIDGDSHEELRARIGVGRLATAADEVVAAHRMDGRIRALLSADPEATP